MNARLLLIRHGLIRANKQRRWHGSTDSALTWRGRRQAADLAARLGDRTIAAIYSSPARRCRATANVMTRNRRLEVVTEADLREWCIGDWEGMSYGQLKRNHDFFRLTSEDLHYAPPNGESVLEVAERTVAALRRIAGQHDGTVAVVGHGAALAVATASLLDDDPTLWGNYSFANCRISELALTPAPKLESYNET